MFKEYTFIFFFMLFLIVVGLLLFLISFLFVYQKPNADKISPYECGFNPFSDARNKFEVRYYLVGILFIIFDLELIYLFPWILVFNSLNFIGIYVMLLFIFILTLGFIYEWLNGALDWQ